MNIDEHVSARSSFDSKHQLNLQLAGSECAFQHVNVGMVPVVYKPHILGSGFESRILHRGDFFLLFSPFFPYAPPPVYFAAYVAIYIYILFKAMSMSLSSWITLPS